MNTNACLVNSFLITNFEKELEPIYKEAIEKFGDNDLFISDEAYWMNGVRDENMKSLRIKNKRKDLSEFWRIFDLIKLKRGCNYE